MFYPAEPLVLARDVTALLTEVRGLRHAMEQMAAAGPRVQLALGRLQLQEQRVNTLVRRLETVRDALSAAHVMAMPSFAEGLPVALMEAMAAGRPCIATLIAGIPELMVDGQTGWLIPAGSEADLAVALDAAARTPRDELDRMGAAARTRALSRHDIATEAAKLAALFAATRNR